jgi:hypothetical protein
MRECPLFIDMRWSRMLLMVLAFLALLTSPISSIVHPDDYYVGVLAPRVISRPGKGTFESPSSHANFLHGVVFLIPKA